MTKKEVNNVEPIGIEQEFRKLANVQKDKEDLDEMVEAMIEDKIRLFKQAWREEKDSEIGKLKKFMDEKFEEMENSFEKSQNKIEARISENVDQKRGEDREAVLQKVEEQCQEIIRREVDLMEERQTGKRKSENEKYFMELRAELREEQQKLGIDLKSEFETGIGKLKSDIECELEKFKANISDRKDVVIKEESPKRSIEVPREDNVIDSVEDQFETKMQSEMNQMKERLKQDFSREVQALEDEIDTLRKTYDSKGYTTDEG